MLVAKAVTAFPPPSPTVDRMIADENGSVTVLPLTPIPQGIGANLAEAGEQLGISL